MGAVGGLVPRLRYTLKRLAFIFFVFPKFGSAFWTIFERIQKILVNSHLPAGITKMCHLDVEPHNQGNKRKHKQ